MIQQTLINFTGDMMFSNSKPALPRDKFLLLDCKTNHSHFSAAQQQSFSILQDMFANWALTH